MAGCTPHVDLPDTILPEAGFSSVVWLRGGPVPHGSAAQQRHARSICITIFRPHVSAAARFLFTSFLVLAPEAGVIALLRQQLLGCTGFPFLGFAGPASRHFAAH